MVACGADLQEAKFYIHLYVCNICNMFINFVLYYINLYFIIIIILSLLSYINIILDYIIIFIILTLCNINNCMLGLNQRKCSPMGSGGGEERVRASIFFTSITSLPNPPPPSPLLLPPYEHEYDSWIPLQECLSSYHGWTYLASFLNELFCIVIGHCKRYFLAWRRHGKSCTLYGRSTLS